MTPMRRGFTLIEVLISLTILFVGILLIIFLFPRTLRESIDAELLTKAALLAQQKAEEIRRDDDQQRTMYFAIARRQRPTVPVPFPEDNRLCYSFSGITRLYNEQPDIGDPGVARVLVSFNKDYRPSNREDRTVFWAAIGPELYGEVIYELRFAP